MRKLLRHLVAWHVLLGGILLFGCLARLLYLKEASDYASFHFSYTGLDTSLYQHLAQQVAAGDILLGQEVYYYSPLYAYVLAGLYVVFGVSPWVASLANVALGVGVIFCVHRYTLSFFCSEKIACIAALGVALYGPFLVTDTSGLKATLGQFLTAASLVLIGKTLQREQARSWFFPGVTLGFALNIINQLSLFLVSLTAWLCLAHPRRMACAGWMLFGVGLALSPFTLRNYVVARELVPITSTGGLHLYIGNHVGAWGGYSPIPGVLPTPTGHWYDARKVAEQEAGVALSASQVSAFWRRKAWTFAMEHPAEALQLLGKKALLLVNAYEIPNNENYQYLRQRSQFLSWFPGIGILFPLGLSGLLLSFPLRRELAPLCLLFCSLNAAVILSFVTWRYRLPLALVLWPFAGCSVVSMFHEIASRRWAHLTVSIGLLIGAWLLAHTPVVTMERRAMDLRLAEARMLESQVQEARVKNPAVLREAILAFHQTVGRIAALHDAQESSLFSTASGAR